jgi:hypothetical protein
VLGPHRCSMGNSELYILRLGSNPEVRGAAILVSIWFGTPTPITLFGDVRHRDSKRLI